jgi:hypothetical protein
MRNEEELQTFKEINVPQTMTRNEERLTGLVTSSVQSAFYYALPKVDRRKNMSEGKTGKKTLAFTGLL